LIAPPRVYIVNAPFGAKIRIMASCTKLWSDALAKADKLVEAYAKAENKSESAAEEPERVREQGDEAMRKCFATRVKNDPAFARLTKQAQQVADTVMGK